MTGALRLGWKIGRDNLAHVLAPHLRVHKPRVRAVGEDVGMVFLCQVAGEVSHKLSFKMIDEGA